MPVLLAIGFRLVYSIITVALVPSWGIVPLIVCITMVGISYGFSNVSQITRGIYELPQEDVEQGTMFI